ncbi:MAG: glycosyltransferase, partial [Bacteroidota bacterium]
DLRSRKVVYLDEYDPADPNQCVITFDGVYENVWKYAAPILKHFGYPFELFIIGQYVGRDNEFDSVEPLTNFASRETLKKLVQTGGRLQWHTWSHKRLLGEQPQDEYDRELIVPADLKALCPDGFKWFAFPHGDRDVALRKQVERHFGGALACDDGTPNDRYDLERTTVFNETRFSNTKVSVIIPCYNYGHLLAEAIESVLLQTVAPDEILVIDDASSDNSVEIARRYEPQVRVEVNPRNLGVVENFKKAVSLTTGDYICFLGADNRFRSDYIEKTKAALDAHSDVAVAYTHFVLFDKRAPAVAAEMGAVPHPGVPGLYLKKFPAAPETDIRVLNYIHGSSMYRRAAYDQVGGYVKEALAEDASLFARMLDHGWKAMLVDDYILEYRQHSREQVNFLKSLEFENVYLRNQYHDMARQIAEKDQQIAQRDAQIAGILGSRSWKFLQILQRIRLVLAPPGSRRERLLYLFFRAVMVIRHEGIRAFLSAVYRKLFKKKTALNTNQPVDSWQNQLTRSVQALQYLGMDAFIALPRYLGRKLNRRPSENVEVSIIIPVFNMLHLTQACIDSIYRETKSHPFEVIIVDNASVDATSGWLLAEKIKKNNLTILSQNKNIGFGPAINKGMGHSQGKYVLLLNNDTIVAPGWLDPLVAAMENDPSIGIVSPVTNYVGDGLQKDGNAEALPPDPAAISQYASQIALRSEILYEASRLVFFCVLLRRKMIERIGYLDTTYATGNFEDDDYCFRARVAGYRLAVVLNTFVYHQGSATFKGNNIPHAQLMAENSRKFYRKIGSFSTSAFHFPAEIPGTVEVSVILRTMNKSATLPLALMSLANQTFKDFEVVVVNDGGEDLTAALSMFQDYFAIQYIHNEVNLGRSAAANAGLDHSRGQWITFLDEDDIVYPWHLESLIQAARLSGSMFVYSDFNHAVFLGNDIREPDILNTPPSWEFNFDDFQVINHIPIHCWLFSRSCIGDIGKIDESLDMLEDYEFLLRLLKQHPFHHLSKITCEYRFYQQKQNSVFSQLDKTLHSLQTIYQRYPTTEPEVARRRVQMIQGMYKQRDEVKEIMESSQSMHEEERNRRIVRTVLGL